ncbi:MAG: hypothetical protein ACI8XV_000560 [Arenicella sp.]|jgi:hypothetical protein
MITRIMNLFPIAITALCLMFLSACSDDLPEVSIENVTEKISMPEELEPAEGSVSSDTNIQNEDLESLAEVSTKADNVSPETEDGYNEEDQSSEVTYDESGTKVSFDSEPSEGIARWKVPQNIAYSNAKITISSDEGETAVRNFSAGEAIELYGNLPDGVYGWKSVITPQIDDFVRKQMRAVRESGDINAERELASRLRDEGSIPTESEALENVQYGNFIVLGGVVNPSSVEEPESAER